MSRPKIPLNQKKETFFKFDCTNEDDSCSFGSFKCGIKVFGILPAHNNRWYLLQAVLCERAGGDRLLAAKVSILLSNVDILVDPRSTLLRPISKEQFQIMPMLFR